MVIPEAQFFQSPEKVAQVSVPGSTPLDACPRRLTYDLRSRCFQLLQNLMNDRAQLKEKQEALARVRPDLIFGFGSPLNPDETFESRVVDHVIADTLKVPGSTIFCMVYMWDGIPRAHTHMTIWRLDRCLN